MTLPPAPALWKCTAPHYCHNRAGKNPRGMCLSGVALCTSDARPPAWLSVPQSEGEMGGERDRSWGHPWGFVCLEGSSDLREGPPIPCCWRGRTSVPLGTPGKLRSYYGSGTKLTQERSCTARCTGWSPKRACPRRACHQHSGCTAPAEGICEQGHPTHSPPTQHGVHGPAATHPCPPVLFL